MHACICTYVRVHEYIIHVYCTLSFLIPFLFHTMYINDLNIIFLKLCIVQEEVLNWRKQLVDFTEKLFKVEEFLKIEVHGVSFSVQILYM